MNHLISILPQLNISFFQTLLMVGIALIVAIVLGLPLGIILFITEQGLFLENKWIKRSVGTVINLIRSTPYIILLVFLLPFTNTLLGTTIGPLAASVSLSVAAIPYYARIVESASREIDKGVIEAAISVGASPWTIIWHVVLPEAKPGLITGLTITAISLISYSAMAGIVGGGGIGDLAIQFGYYRYDNTVMYTTVIILIILVQFIQFLGDYISKSVDKR